MPELNFENKTVLVTGATRGIGASIATAFLTAGAKVIGTGTHEASSGSFDEYFQADFKFLFWATYPLTSNKVFLFNNLV